MKKTSIITGAVCIVIGVGLLVALVTFNWGWSPTGSGMMGDIDRHFIEQMIPHHEDAVAMAELALDRAEHGELRQLAETIKRDQSREIDQMRAWYEAWYGVSVPDGTLARGRGMMGMGMMSDSADFEVLNAAQSFDREFIEQMRDWYQDWYGS